MSRRLSPRTVLGRPADPPGEGTDGTAKPPRLRARERGRARRRLRYLRQVRELQLRDAGGFVFDLFRFGERRDELVRAKLDALIATDTEIRALEALLGQGGQVRDVRQPGVGGTCPNCGAFHSSQASFCAHCGVGLAVASAAEAAEPVAETPTPPEPDVEVTIVRQAAGEPREEPSPAPATPEPNGAAPTSDVEPPADDAGPPPTVTWPESEHDPSPNGEQPAPDVGEVDPDTGEVAAVARRRRGRDQ